MKVGEKQVLGDFNADVMQKIYETTLAAAATSVTISSLNGDTDEEYCLICRFVSGAANATYLLRPNNDTGNNYGYQYLMGVEAVPSAVRDTSEAYARLTIGIDNDADTLVYSNTTIYAKSGYIRTLLTTAATKISATTVSSAELISQSWNNTTDEITSLVVLSGAADGLGIGTNIQLYAKREHT